MRVLFFLRSFPAVSETFVVHQIEGVIERGHEVQITADRPATDADTDLQAQMSLAKGVLYRPRGWPNRYLRGIQTLALAIAHGWRAPTEISGTLNIPRFRREARSGRALRAMIPLLLREARAFDADIVHAHFGPAGVLAAILKDLGVITAPLVVTFHGFDANVMPRRMGPGYYDLLFAIADRIMVGTEFMKQRLLELGASADRVVKLPMGVDTSRFAKPVLEKATGSPLVILSVGRLVGNKGLRDGIVAFGELVQQHPRAEYRIVGEGSERESLETVARDAGIADRVTFLGNQSPEKITELYAQADVFLHPSKVGEDGSAEGQGLVLAEAAASTLPIVATRVGGIPETVIDNENGFLADQGDAASLAAHLNTLLGDSSLRTRMGQRGRRLAEEQFEQSRLDDRLIEIYQEVVDL